MTKWTRPAPKNHHAGFSLSNPRHLGLDYGWGAGDTVSAAADGVVVSVYTGGGYNGGWGNLIIIDHGNGNFSAYAHLASGTITVSKGQRVSAGQKLGIMGATGKVSAKHLHFEFRYPTAAPTDRKDPAPYFYTDLPGTATPPPQPAGGTSGKRQVKNPVGAGYLNGRLEPVLAGKAVQQLAAGTIGEFDGYIRGEQVTVNGTTSNIWYRGLYRGNYFAAAGFTTIDGTNLKDLGTFAGAPTPAPPAPPAPRYWFKTPAAGQFWYPSHAAALSGKGYNPKALPPNTEYEVVGNPGGGPIIIAVPGIGNVYVGTRNHPAPHYRR